MGVGVLSMRILQIQTEKNWPWLEATASMLFVVQIAAALHYLPLTPLAVGVILLGTLFSIITFIINLFHQVAFGRAVIESGITFVVSIILALFLN
jgi:hypothetical protein